MAVRRKKSRKAPRKGSNSRAAKSARAKRAPRKADGTFAKKRGSVKRKRARRSSR